jgi:hypothetical protein
VITIIYCMEFLKLMVSGLFIFSFALLRFLSWPLFFFRVCILFFLKRIMVYLIMKCGLWWTLLIFFFVVSSLRWLLHCVVVAVEGEPLEEGGFPPWQFGLFCAYDVIFRNRRCGVLITWEIIFSEMVWEDGIRRAWWQLW